MDVFLKLSVIVFSLSIIQQVANNSSQSVDLQELQGVRSLCIPPPFSFPSIMVCSCYVIIELWNLDSVRYFFCLQWDMFVKYLLQGASIQSDFSTQWQCISIAVSEMCFHILVKVCHVDVFYFP